MARGGDAKGLQLHPSWLAKCVQLYETYQVRHGIMLVGPTGSGKTAIAETLAAALTRDWDEARHLEDEPEGHHRAADVRSLDARTGDWTDGVFAVLWRRAAKEKKNNTWIVLDGPVDAIWIENLNTVLDDNKVLTLANGDRVQMSGKMKAMFEPENLNNASPATVSRAGIIYVSDTELGWRRFVTSWLEARARKPRRRALRPLSSRQLRRPAAARSSSLECKPGDGRDPVAARARDFCSVGPAHHARRPR